MMTAPRRYADRLKNAQLIIAITIGCAAIIGGVIASPDMIYNKLFSPRVEKQIDCKQKSMIDELVFLNIQISQMLDSTKAARAESQYASIKRSMNLGKE